MNGKQKTLAILTGTVLAAGLTSPAFGAASPLLSHRPRAPPLRGPGRRSWTGTARSSPS